MDKTKLETRIAELETSIEKSKQDLQALRNSFQQQDADLQNKIVLLMGALGEKKADLEEITKEKAPEVAPATEQQAN